MENTSFQAKLQIKQGSQTAQTWVDASKIDFELTTDNMETLIEKHQDFYEGVNSFDFNIFEFARSVGRNMQMPFLATSLLKQNDCLQFVNYPKFLKFFSQIYNKYDQNVHYHNDLHGSDVAQHCNVILKTQNMKEYAQFNSLDTISLLVSAFCHDVQHDGFNNGYHKVTQSMLYHMFGDQAIQENNHAAQTLQLLDNSDYDFISGQFKQSETRVIKKRIIESILCTDMASMNDLRKDFQNHLDKFAIRNGENQHKFIDSTSPKTVEKSKQLMTSVILHACDISTSLRDFNTSTQWADLLFQEFFTQGDIEKSKGMKVSPMCDRHTTKIAGGQAGFISFLVMPIFMQLSEVCPEIKLQIESGAKNIESWKVKAKTEEKQIFSEPLMQPDSKKVQNRSLDEIKNTTKLSI